MNKKLGLFLLALVLTVAAFVSAPPAAEAARCIEPACFASPGCCFNFQCNEWCGGYGLGACSGGGLGGCCYCVG